ncbi:MAG: Rne/Rng family ribonuclease [Lentisphaeria bacterium]|nr:Rne/Rng family ribonuclease [Lentisphaeria bacterium]
MKQILINSEELQVRVAVVEDGTLQDFFMERTNKDRLVGSIYKGKIKNLEPSLQAAFVDIGVGKNAFLHYWDMLPATLEKLEGDGDDDDEPTKPGQERADADLINSADEDDSYDPPAPPSATETVEETDAAEAEEASDTPAEGVAEIVETPAPQAPAVIPTVTMEGETVPADTKQLTKGLIPLTDANKTGLIPLGKPAVPKAEPAAQEEATATTATKEEAPAPVAPVQQIVVDENPPPQAEDQAPAGNGGQQNGNRKPPRPPRPQQDFQNNGQQPQNGEGNGSHRRRHRRRGGGQQGGNGPEGQLVPLQRTSAQSPKRPGIFRRIFEALFPGLKKKPQTTPQQPAQRPVQQKPALSPNTGKNEILPLTPNGKAGSAKPMPPQQPKMEKLPKPEKPKKPEKKGPTVEDIPNLFHVDQEILVQVTKGPIGTKGARVTTNLSIPGRYLVLLPNCPHVGISRRVEDREERSRLKQMIKTILPPNMGVICRTEGAGLKREHFQRDLQMLLDAWHKGEETASRRRAPVCVYQEPALVERTLRDSLTQDIDEIVCDTKEAFDLAQEMLRRFERQDSVKVKLYSNPTPIFIKYGISQQIEGLSNRKVPLPSGGYLCIDETEALIAIDVNTGKNRAGKDQPETILSTNMEAVKEIARQLRLRNIGGLVVLDLIDMRSRKDQMAVYRAFKQYTAEDHARIKLYPISGLGLLEMSRQRESESLESTMFEDCPYCKGRGLIKTATSVSVEIQRRLNELLARKKDVQHFVITVHPKILERLRTADHKVMNAMAAENSRQLTFNADASLHIEAFHITDKVTGKEY